MRGLRAPALSPSVNDVEGFLPTRSSEDRKSLPASGILTRVKSTRPTVSPARAAAFDILIRIERESSYASELLHSRTYDRLTTIDHALATELVMGVLRWRSLLDTEIAGSSAQPLAKLDLEVLTALRLALYQLRWLRVPPRAAINESVELVKRARTELSEEIRSLRQLMSELRPPILDEGGLEAALRDHLSSWTSASGIEIRLEAASHGLLSLESETVVYRVVQEALANVAKHSRAKLTTVTMSHSGNGVQIVVRDDGKGFDAPSQPDLLRGGHFGLVVMRERVELASGRFEIHSAPRTGTEVVAWLPTIPAYRSEEVA